MKRKNGLIAAALVVGAGVSSPSAHAAFDVDQCMNLAKRLHASRYAIDCPKAGPVGSSARGACEFAAEFELAWETALCKGRGLPGAAASAFDRYLEILPRSMSPLYPN